MFDEKTIPLFRLEELQYTVEERIEKAVSAIVALFMQRVPVVCAFSGGKDSSVVVALALHAAVLAKIKGARPFIVVTTSDTLVESPEVQALYRSELACIAAFGKRNDIEITTSIVAPNLLASWQLKVLTGRGLPSFAGVSNDCSQDMKIFPQIRFRRALFRRLAERGLPEPCTLIGTRLDESERRAARMKARQDRPDVPVKNKDGELVMTPLRDWDSDAVWEAIALYGSSVYPSYSNFEETKRIYAHAAGTSCAVVADAIYEGGSKKRQGRCGARTGCWTCLATEDKSLANMIEFDERYAYARGLHRFNRFLRNTRYDWTLRHWVGRTIREGFVSLEPDTYHPKMLRMLTRFMLQLDYDEEVRARLAGKRPKFKTLPLDMMVAVDAMQSLQGVARSFSCWADYCAIRSGQVRYDIPDVPAVRPTTLPDARFLHVGKDWEDTLAVGPWAGLRDPLIEHLTEGGGCERELVELKNGRVVWAIDKHSEFSVDVESVCMIEDFELDRILEMHERPYIPGGITAAYKWYFAFGCLNLSSSQQAKHDEICRRTSFKDSRGLTLDYDIGHLLGQSTSFAELPDAARRAWAHKATTDSSQTEFELAIVA
jgi:DNA sulfur modification protein DndC